MTAKNFQAMVVREGENKEFIRAIEERSVDQLPDGDVLVRVKHSSLNYKDGLSATGNRGVTRTYPHTPGIDSCGVIEQSRDNAYRIGDEVIVTSYDLGMNTPGGFGQYIRVPSDWVVPLPAGMTLFESMIYGTAGFTAAMAVYALQKTVPRERGEVLVTGASGGVGSLAVAILSKLGYEVVAVSGKEEAKPFLQKVGARDTLTREEATAGNERALLRTRWAGVIDTVGGEMLSAAIKSTDFQGVVTCCGNVASPDLPINVYPFILRGVSLIGIDSQNCPMDHRRYVWDKMAVDWKPEALDEIYREVSLYSLDTELDKILKGRMIGRVVVNLN